MQNREIEIGKKQQEGLFKVILNDRGDFIYLDDKDQSIFDRFTGFARWLEDTDKEIQSKGKEIETRYGGTGLKRDEDGNIAEINIEAISEMSEFRMGIYREAVDRINNIFGENTIQRYFYRSYENNPDFVPGDECLYDFLDEMTPVLTELFSSAHERTKEKYSKNRKGGKLINYRTED